MSVLDSIGSWERGLLAAVQAVADSWARSAEWSLSLAGGPVEGSWYAIEVDGVQSEIVAGAGDTESDVLAAIGAATGAPSVVVGGGVVVVEFAAPVNIRGSAVVCEPLDVSPERVPVLYAQPGTPAPSPEVEHVTLAFGPLTPRGDGDEGVSWVTSSSGTVDRVRHYVSNAIATVTGPRGWRIGESLAIGIRLPRTRDALESAGCFVSGVSTITRESFAVSTQSIQRATMIVDVNVASMTRAPSEAIDSVDAVSLHME